MNCARHYRAAVIGVSSGGLEALSEIFSKLDKNFQGYLLVVQHLSIDSDDFLVRYLDDLSELRVCEAEDKLAPQKGWAYVAPANYHLLVEPDGNLALSTEARVNYSRPSVDVLFETAAEAYNTELVGVILTGANSDGAKGLKAVKRMGGLTVVQDPQTAIMPKMPQAALKQVMADYVLPLEIIGDFLNNLFKLERRDASQQ